MTDEEKKSISAELAQELAECVPGRVWKNWAVVANFDTGKRAHWTYVTVVVAHAEALGTYGFDYVAHGPDSEYDYWLDFAPKEIALRPISAHTETITTWKYEESK